ncbi:hypothetical protein HG537_0C03970 [Torulaspora globosa]|uniref:Uncharacterized protein n=1 Tax=Torulaspora globosa TaxID=48254 RepID=A0A7H9HPT7_9SACH|nr:hypothetical protein HG537_0C03970 [Torulaspora sp. CBS 2947]
MAFNTPPSQSEYININNFNQFPLDLREPQQQQPTSPPPFNSPLVYENNGSSSSGSSSGSSLDFDTLKYKNDISKSFEDDLFYCPRSLLSEQEQLNCEKVDLYMAKQLREYQLALQQHSLHSSSPNSNLVRPKFNPYTSQSFSPAPSNGAIR